jgi:hypothetical protein
MACRRLEAFYQTVSTPKYMCPLLEIIMNFEKRSYENPNNPFEPHRPEPPFEPLDKKSPNPFDPYYPGDAKARPSVQKKFAGTAAPNIT